MHYSFHFNINHHHFYSCVLDFSLKYAYLNYKTTKGLVNVNYENNHVYSYNKYFCLAMFKIYCI